MNRRIENENRRTAKVQSEYKATVKKVTQQDNSLKDGNSKAVNIIIIFLSAVVVVLLALLIRNTLVYNSNKEKIEKENENLASILDLNIQGEFVQGLYKKIPAGKTGVEPYYAITTKYEDLSENNRLAYVLNLLQEGTDVEDFEYEVVNEEYKKIYGSSKVAPKINADNNQASVYEYIAEGDYYHREDYNHVYNFFFTFKNEIEKVEKNSKNTEVYIYDKFVCFDEAGDINSFGSFKTSDKTEVIETGLTRGYDSGINQNIYGGKTVSEILDENIDNAGRFKHTFKLDEAGNYYWYSSEYIT